MSTGFADPAEHFEQYRPQRKACHAAAQQTSGRVTRAASAFPCVVDRPALPTPVGVLGARLLPMTIAENRLIALLPSRERAALISACSLVELSPSMVLGTPGEVTRHAYFPLDCAIALVTLNGSEPGLEVGLVGREGMLGVQLVLGVSAVPLHSLVQGAGMARRIGAAPFRRLLSASHPLQRTLHGYVHVLMVQLASSAACTRFHHVEPRLARWLLMTHDRALSDSFHLTHEFLGHVLGVRRVGITGAARDLQRRGLIRYHRGLVTVLDRTGLESCACSCYAANRQAYDAGASAARGARAPAARIFQPLASEG